jgi:hypothetical protein
MIRTFCSSTHHMPWKHLLHILLAPSSSFQAALGSGLVCRICVAGRRAEAERSREFPMHLYSLGVDSENDGCVTAVPLAHLDPGLI